MKRLTKLPLTIASLFAILLFSPSFVSAQGYGMGGMGGYGMGMGGMGMGMGYGMGGFGGEGVGGPGAFVTVKYGEKVYDAIYNDLVDYKVYYIQVPADTIGVHYFDDGQTNGDEVPYDGMPSNITINRNMYLGPFTIKYKKMLSNAVKHAREMGALEFYRLGVATESVESTVTKMDDWKMSFSTFLEDISSQRLAQFEGFDDRTYIKSIDPSLFESMEGFGGMGGSGFGAGGFLPDLPPPPGLPNPMETGFGQEIGDGFNADTGGTTQDSGRFDPIGRANNAANLVEGGQ